MGTGPTDEMAFEQSLEGSRVGRNSRQRSSDCESREAGAYLVFREGRQWSEAELGGRVRKTCPQRQNQGCILTLGERERLGKMLRSDVI